MYQLGGRRFLLQSVPGIERSPKYLYTDEQTRNNVAQTVERFNEELKAVMNRFQAQHNDVMLPFPVSTRT
jgi:hypothetical protein